MVRIITDSTSDISIGEARNLGIDLLPLIVNFGDDSYRDGVDMTPEAFYEKLSKVDALPFTSQINPGQFEEIFREYINAGDQIVCILISSKLSGTYQSAVIAKELIDSKDIHVIDSKHVTFSLAMQVYRAAELRDSGADASEIAQEILYMRDKIRLVAAVDTLKYLKMGGRLSTATALIGELLGISPLISVEEGEVKSIGKARGRKNALEAIYNKFEEDGADPRFKIGFGHSNAPEALKEIMDFFAAKMDISNAVTVNIGCIVGTHAGPGAVGIAYVRK